MAHPECCEPCEFLPIYGQLPDFLTHESYYGDMGFRCVLCNTWCVANQPCDVRDDPHLKSEAHFRRMGRWLFARYAEDYPITWANLLICFDRQDLLPSSWAPLCEKYAKQQQEREEWEAEEARRKSNPKADVDPQGNSAESWHVSQAAASDAGWRDWSSSSGEPRDHRAREVQRVGLDLAKLRELHEKVEGLEADLAAAKVGVEKIGRLEADIAAGKAEVKEIEVRLGAPAPSEVSEKLQSLEAKLGTAEVEAQKIERLEADSATAKDELVKIVRLEAESATAKEELVKIGRLEAELTALQDQFKTIARLEAMLTDTRTKVENIERARAAVANSQVVHVDNQERLEADATAAQADVKDELTKHLEKIERLEAGLADTQAETEKISTLESKLAAAEAKIEELEHLQADSANAATLFHQKIGQLEAATADCSRKVAACSDKASDLEKIISEWQTWASGRKSWPSWNGADEDKSGDTRGRGRTDTRGGAGR